MKVADWVEENLEYGRKLVQSGLEGVQAGSNAALGEETVPQVLVHSAPATITLAAACAGIGVLASYVGNQRKLTKEAAVFGLLGGIAGFVVGLGWSTRHLANGARVAALHEMRNVRDEHWLDHHPIDYA